jgi:hypothetical protein
MLRQRLFEMTTEDESRHSELLAQLTRQHPNAITVLESPQPIRGYTCLVHVFDFTEQPEYEIIVRRSKCRNVFAGANFAHWLFDIGALEEIPSLQPGHLVFYFDDFDCFKHVGIIQQDGRVASKWGTGQLFEHGLFEVPASYGNNVKFFKKPPSEVVFNHFKQFEYECWNSE